MLRSVSFTNKWLGSKSRLCTQWMCNLGVCADSADIVLHQALIRIIIGAICRLCTIVLQPGS